MFQIKCLAVWLCLLPLFLFAQPNVQLANVFSEDVHVKEYLISEKYDGIRAIWTGEKLVTRQGNPIFAPKWFTDKLPRVWLDGELWSTHNDFSFIMSTVRKQTPVDSEWRKIYYMVFDAPDRERNMTFEERYKRYTRLLTILDLPNVRPVEQFSVRNNEALHSMLAAYVNKGAEGLMLHRKLARFERGRTDNLLKLKPHMEADAQVIEILNGSGKYDGMMGSVLVEMPSGIRFKIGSGFSDEERNSPPNIGDNVIYKYHGFTERGIPRFASFLRFRDTRY
ncbi:DNA ligase-1 [Marinomonas polaris DSM 16579]|uniref:DNA ligase-1 n=1 Tax=Marinomonas polaris DSM 16579 TaxID=1122206 RepID=A0A1M5LLA7_9GAMM|nr:DNA ligase [Marinomonas polaris]SHG65133.1 DNA ligase-1 [Marinomonas polaris DSM 16579]